MIPTKTREILGSGQPVIRFEADAPYALEGYQFAELEALMRRLGTEQRMQADEMRDWMNRLHAMLGSVVKCG